LSCPCVCDPVILFFCLLLVFCCFVCLLSKRVLFDGECVWWICVYPGCRDRRFGLQYTEYRHIGLPKCRSVSFGTSDLRSRQSRNVFVSCAYIKPASSSIESDSVLRYLAYSFSEHVSTSCVQNPQFTTIYHYVSFIAII